MEVMNDTLSRVREFDIPMLHTDIENNIQKVYCAVAKKPDLKLVPEQGELTVQLMLRRDGTQKNPSSLEENSFSLAILWLVRSLKFISNFLELLIKRPDDSVSSCLIVSYKHNLMAYHSQIMKVASESVLKFVKNDRAHVLNTLNCHDMSVVNTLKGIALSLIHHFGEPSQGVNT